MPTATEVWNLISQNPALGMIAGAWVMVAGIAWRHKGGQRASPVVLLSFAFAFTMLAGGLWKW